MRFYNDPQKWFLPIAIIIAVVITLVWPPHW